MVSKLKKALIVLVILALAFVGVVAIQPEDFRIVRSASMTAPPPMVFRHVNDLHLWEDWSPWAKLDPAMKTKYDGAPSGTGAIHSWNGNSEVGEGNTTIVESKPSDVIRIKLTFVRPFACTNDVEFTFKPEGEQKTLVTWTMTGKNNFVGKAVDLLMNMDKMVGSQFEQGLAKLKTVVETAKPAVSQ